MKVTIKGVEKQEKYAYVEDVPDGTFFVLTGGPTNNGEIAFFEEVFESVPDSNGTKRMRMLSQSGEQANERFWWWPSCPLKGFQEVDVEIVVTPKDATK